MPASPGLQERSQRRYRRVVEAPPKQELHLHFYGVSAEDVAEVVRRQQGG